MSKIIPLKTAELFSSCRIFWRLCPSSANYNLDPFLEEIIAHFWQLAILMFIIILFFLQTNEKVTQVFTLEISPPPKKKPV